MANYLFSFLNWFFFFVGLGVFCFAAARSLLTPGSWLFLRLKVSVLPPLAGWLFLCGPSSGSHAREGGEEDGRDERDHRRYPCPGVAA
jgi:hypothetical protein